MSTNSVSAAPRNDPSTSGPRPRIGPFEGLAIRFAGLRDRLRCREVADGTATHWLHELQARVQAGETRAVRAVDAATARLERELAEVAVLLSRSAPPDPEPGAVGPRAAHADAVQRRAARSRRLKQQAHQREREAAELRKAVLLAQRTAVLHDLANAQESAREAFDVRAARYTRARTGWFGLPRQREHRVPSYTRAAGPARLPVGSSAEFL